MKEDYYKTLGVAKNSSADELKKAYRSLAMKYHPDRNPGDKKSEQKFKEISEAYDVLKDEQKRAAYDRFGHSAFEGGGPTRARGSDGFEFTSANFSDIFGDIFGDFMGGGGRANATSTKIRGSDLRYNLQISLEEAFEGKAVNIKFSSSVPCNTCHSTGSADKNEAVNCATCHGAGRIRVQQGFFAVEKTCHSCYGMGKVIKNPCRVCGGEGRVQKERTLAINIPAGVEDGTRIRLAGEGEAGVRGGQSGDLYIFTTIAKHPVFSVEGTTIYCKVPISVVTAALGGSIEVPTIEGSIAKVNINAGTQTGDQFRLKGKGMSAMRSKQRGDMYIQVVVETPTNLSSRQKELLLEFDKISKESNKEPSLFEKIKKYKMR